MASTLTTLTRPLLVAMPYAAVPTSSSAPGSATAGRARSGTRTDERAISRTAAVPASRATRLVSSAAGGESFEASANSVRNVPNVTAASSDITTPPWTRTSPCCGALRAAASATPTTASGMPRTCSSDGRSPSPTATSTGTIPPVAPIGATTLIGPIAAAL